MLSPSRSMAGVLGSCFVAALVLACGSDGGASDDAPMGSGGSTVGPAGAGGAMTRAGAPPVAGSGMAAGGAASSGGPGVAGAATSAGAGGSNSPGGASSAGAGASPGGHGGDGGKGNASGAGGAGGSGGMKSMGGAGTAGSKNQGGASGAAGSAGAGGAGGSSGSKSTGGAGNIPAIGPRRCGCEQTAGEFGTVDATIVVAKGQVYDGACKIFRANPDTLGDGNQDEDQKPVFRVEDGATLRNVVLGASAADGVHTYGDVTLENIHWLDIGEDAMTVKESGTVRLDCGSAAKGSDKMFQVNAASEIFISHFTGKDAGKFMRQNGDTTFKVTVTIDHCDISGMKEVIFRTDSSTSHVTLKNTRYSGLGDGLFMFGDSVVNGNSNQSTVSNNMEY